MSGRGRRPRWGQNFLIDAAAAQAIVGWAAIEGRTVLEIGPGDGALTGLLAERAHHLTLVEIDPKLAASLRRRYASEARVEVIEADVLRVDLGSLAMRPFSVVGNLPYESATAIVRKLVSAPDAVSEAVVMLQKEVCDRLLATRDDPSYGALSIFTAMRADVSPGCILEPSSFRPRPKVRSQVVRIRPLRALRWEVGNERFFEDLVHAAFGGRRKMLRNTLGRWLAEQVGECAMELFTECGLAPTARPQEIAAEDFARLATRSYELLRHRAGAS
jgi:16S rRNA (adenine1518-N6/adenine1519-N6)-dimethyltransferase